MKRVIACASGLLFTVCALIMSASPPVGVTPTLIGRGTYHAFKVKSDKRAPFEFEAEAKPAIDMVVRVHDYAVDGSTGWHTHPGPVFITVLSGEVTFYEFDDPSCTPHLVRAGEGYVDTGRGHIGINKSGKPAKDVTVIIAPVGGGFRDELPAPGPYCPF